MAPSHPSQSATIVRGACSRGLAVLGHYLAARDTPRLPPPQTCREQTRSKSCSCPSLSLLRIYASWKACGIHPPLSWRRNDPCRHSRPPVRPVEAIASALSAAPAHRLERLSCARLNDPCARSVVRAIRDASAEVRFWPSEPHPPPLRPHRPDVVVGQSPARARPCRSCASTHRGKPVRSTRRSPGAAMARVDTLVHWCGQSRPLHPPSRPPPRTAWSVSPARGSTRRSHLHSRWCVRSACASGGVMCGVVRQWAQVTSSSSTALLAPSGSARTFKFLAGTLRLNCRKVCILFRSTSSDISSTRISSCSSSYTCQSCHCQPELAVRFGEYLAEASNLLRLVLVSVRRCQC